MDKIFKILIVFGLVMLLIYRFIRGREPSYRPYGFLLRLRPPLSDEVVERLIVAEDGSLLETDQLSFHYLQEGILTIYRRRPQGRAMELQELAVPVDCTAMALDPVEDKLYFEAAGTIFVYGRA